MLFVVFTFVEKLLNDDANALWLLVPVLVADMGRIEEAGEGDVGDITIG